MKANQASVYVLANGGKRVPEMPVSIVASSEQDAIRLYWLATDRLLNVNQWSSLIRSSLPHFSLIDQNGKLLEGKAAPGNLIRINFPGLSISSASVPEEAPKKIQEFIRVEKIEHHAISEVYELFIMQLKWSSFPAESHNEGNPSFSFILERDRHYVNATIYGLKTDQEIYSDQLSAGKDRKRKKGTDMVKGQSADSKMNWEILAASLLKA